MEGDIGETNKNFELEKLRLIDISSEDDFLIDSRLYDSFEGFRLSVALEHNRENRDSFGPFPAWNRQKVVNSADVFGQSKQESRQNGECNLRKSLAWDSAFFTSAGVLDPEELSMVNKGFRKTEMHLLPGIDEELQSSAVSNCTMGSNSLSFESLEIDLFKDLTESNQKSRKESFVASSRRALGKGAATKKLEGAPRNMMKLIPASGRQSINTKGLERISREHNASSRESNSTSVRPPKLSGRSKPISATPTKRASFGNAVPEHMMASKKPCLGNSSSVTPGSTKSYSSGSSTVTSGTVSCYSYDRSGNTSSDTTGKSPWNSLRRKIDSGNVDHAALGSQTRTFRCSIRNKSQLESSSSSSIKSMTKLSSGLSPASSMDHWSSESSCSSSINNEKSKIPKANLAVTPCKGPLFDCHATRSDLESHSGSSPVSVDFSSHSKPSALRLPSPKIGYFDGEKFPVLTPKELQFYGQQGTSPKAGTRINNLKGVSNGTIHGKFQPVRTVMGSGNKNLPSPALGTSLVNTSQFHKLKNASPEVPVISGNMKTCLGMVSKSQTSLSPKMRPHLKTNDVRRRLHVSSESGLGLSSKSDEKGTERSLKNRKGVVQLKANNSGRSKDGASHTQNRFNPAMKVHEEGSQHRLENNRHLPYVSGKENLFRYDDQVDDLSKHLGSIDLSGDVVMEL